VQIGSGIIVEVEQVSTRVAYANPWMTVREDSVRMSDGSLGVYGVVEKPDFALIIPVAEGGVWMVEQFRYPVGRRGWEFPMGSWPAGGGGSALDLARHELAEETGLTASTWRHLGRLAQANGFSTQGFDVFMASDLVEGPPNREATEQDMVHRLVTEPELARMIRHGAVIDAATLAALTLLHLAGAH
jgi:8-oxo-dGTP pyrophosphatase MutT (NUDIX family)